MRYRRGDPRRVEPAATARTLASRWKKERRKETPRGETERGSPLTSRQSGAVVSMTPVRRWLDATRRDARRRAPPLMRGSRRCDSPRAVLAKRKYPIAFFFSFYEGKNAILYSFLVNSPSAFRRNETRGFKHSRRRLRVHFSYRRVCKIFYIFIYASRDAIYNDFAPRFRCVKNALRIRRVRR